MIIRFPLLILIMLWILIPCHQVYSQSKTTASTYPEGLSKKKANKLFKKAQERLYQGKYELAKQNYLTLLEADPNNFDYNFDLGVTYFYSATEKDKSIKYLEKADTLSNPENRGDIAFFLGRAYQINERYLDARNNYQKYLSQLETEGTALTEKDEAILFRDLRRQIEMCTNAIELTNNPIKTIIRNGVVSTFTMTSLEMNTPHDEYGSLLLPSDSMMYITSRRQENTGGRKDFDDKYYEDIYFTQLTKVGWLGPLPLDNSINSWRHDATNSFSNDYKEMYIYRGRQNGTVYRIQYQGGNLSKPKKLSRKINQWSLETSFTPGPNDSTFYIVSDRKGGLGGRDIYTVVRKQDGSFGELVNLGPSINSAYDEDSPYYSKKENKFFFASTGHNSMGGFDMFSSEIANGTYSPAMNLGYPFNSSSDDIYYIEAHKSDIAYLSSNRVGMGKGEMDVYRLTFTCPDIPLATIFGRVILDNGQDAAGFVIIESTTKDSVAMKDGMYIINMVPSTDYTLTVKPSGYIPQSIAFRTPPQCKSFPIYQETRFSIEKNTDGNPVRQIMISSIANINMDEKTGNSSSEPGKAVSKYYDYLNSLNPAEKAFMTVDTTFLEITPEDIIALNQSKQPKSDTLVTKEKDPGTSASYSDLDLKFATVYFDFNRTDIKQEYKAGLDSVIKLMKSNRDLKIQINGHTDNKGSEQYNLRLSRQRSDAVRRYIMSKGIPERRILTRQIGSGQPAAPNILDNGIDNEEGRRLNRRADIIVIKDPK